MNFLNKQHLNNLNLYIVLIFILSSCASMNVTQESVSDSEVQTVKVSKSISVEELDYETKAIFANATVYFEFDRSNLTSKSIQILKSVIDAMKGNSAIKITISGHADERGTREYNLALGQRRAESVKDYFVLNGINASRISVKSFGEEKLLSDGIDEASHSKNRRAEIN